MPPDPRDPETPNNGESDHEEAHGDDPSLSREAEAVRQVLVDLWERDHDQPGWLVVPQHRALYDALYSHFLSLKQEEAAWMAASAVPPPYADHLIPAAPMVVEQPTVGASATAVAAARPPRPSLTEFGRRFISTHAILLMAYLGAFLLLVAALLFLLYGPADLPGGARVVTVAGVNGVLAGGAVVCRRRQALRLVASTYTAIAALMVPVTLTATYEFVLRDATPLTGTTAISMSAVACAILYGLLARSLDSRAYASLSLLAVAVGGVAGAVAAGSGPTALPLAAVGVLLCWLLHRSEDRAFALPSVIAGHLTAWATVGAAIGFTAAGAAQGGGSFPPYMSLSFAAIGIAYLVRQRLAGDGVAMILAATLLNVAVLTATQTLGLGATGAAASLIGSGLLLATLSRRGVSSLVLFGRPLSSQRMTLAVAWLAAAELAAAGLVPMTPTGTQLTLIPAAVAGGFIIASRRSGWWLATGVAALALQVAVHARDQPLLPVTPAYIPTTLAVLLVALSALAGRTRERVLAVPAAVTLIAAMQALGGALQWNADEHAIALIVTAFAVAAVARLIDVRFLHRAGLPGLDNALAWTAAMAAAGAGLFPMVNPVLQLIVLWAATTCGLLMAVRLSAPAWLVVGVAALALQTATDANAIGQAGVSPAYVPLTLTAIFVSIAVVAAVSRDRRLVIPANLCVTAIALAADSAAGLGAQWYAIELVALAYLGSLTALVAGRPTLSTLLRLGAGARLVLAGAIVVSLPLTETLILAAGVACASWLAYSSRRPEWLYLAGLLFGGGWYEAATTAQATVDVRSAVGALSPLPFVYALFAAVLARITSPQRRRMWIVPPAGFAVAGVIALDGVAIGVEAWTVLAWSLFVQGLVAYAFGRALGRAELVPLAAAFFAGSAFTLLLAVNAPLMAYPLTLAAVAWAIALGARITSPAESPREWAMAHRWAALVVAALSAAAPVVNGAFAGKGGTATIAELVASLSLALVLWAGVAAGMRVRDRYLAIVVASLAIEWLPVYVGVTDVQAYVVLPSVTLIACGIAAGNDRRAALPPLAADGLVAVGCAAATLTSFVQALTIGVASWYTAWLLVEGLAALGTAIVARSRLLSVAGAAAMAAAAGLALDKVVSSVPLYAVFGIAAVLLMVVASVLATQRARIQETRESLRQTWRTWGQPSTPAAPAADHSRGPYVGPSVPSSAQPHSGRASRWPILVAGVVTVGPRRPTRQGEGRPGR